MFALHERLNVQLTGGFIFSSFLFNTVLICNNEMYMFLGNFNEDF